MKVRGRLFLKPLHFVVDYRLRITVRGVAADGAKPGQGKS